jgi:hypothetical protein
MDILMDWTMVLHLESPKDLWKAVGKATLNKIDIL